MNDLILSKIESQSLRVGSDYALQLHHEVPLNVRYTLAVDRLPEGLALGPGGRIEGTPTKAGSVTSTVTLTPAHGVPVSQSIAFSVTGDKPATAAPKPAAA